MKITLPKSKYVLELKDFVSNRVFREYQKILVQNVDVAGGKEIEIKIKMAQIYEAQDFVLEKSIVSLTDENGTVLEKPFEVVQDLSVEDGEVVYAKIQELVGGSTMDEKVKKNG